MQYTSVTKLKPEEIDKQLSIASSEEDILNLVLSAVYFCDTEFAGDCLLKTLSNSSGSLALSLIRVTNTYLQTHRTAHNASKFLIVMQSKCLLLPENKLEILDLIEGVEELKEKFNVVPSRRPIE